MLDDDHSLSFAGSEEALRAALRDVVRSALAPRPRLRPSEWAERTITLTGTTSSRRGKLKLFGYQRGILDAAVEPGVEEIAIMKASRTGYTQMQALWVLYAAATRPSPVVAIMPKESSSRAFERKYLRPMIQASAELRDLFPDMEKQPWKSKLATSGATIDLKDAILPDNFAEYHARTILGDEIDRIQWRAGGEKTSEGDKLSLMRKRLDSFDDGVAIVGSSPGLAAASLIEPRFLLGDQRRFFVPCPHCGGMQHLEWGGRDKKHGVTWPDGHPEQAYYVCKFADDPEDQSHWIHEHHKLDMLEAGEWRPTAQGQPGIISFHLPALISPFKKASWGRLAVQFVNAARLSKATGDEDELQAFINTALGETFKPGKRLSDRRATPHDLIQRNTIRYKAPVPKEARVLTCFVDVQTGSNGASYFEVGVWGWGEAERGWLIEQRVLDEYPLSDPAAWFALEDYLRRGFRGEDGKLRAIQGTCIDYGGTFGQQVSDFAARMAGWKVWATKGRGRGADQRRQVWPRDPSKTKHGGTVYEICTWRTKDILYERLTREPPAPGSLSFPEELVSGSIAGALPIDAAYFTRLTREEPSMMRGVVRWDNQPGDQEPWDCLLGAYAALHGLMSIPELGIRERVAAPRPPKKIGRPPVPGATAAPAEAKPPAPVKRSKPKPTFGMGTGSRWSKGGLLRGGR